MSVASDKFEKMIADSIDEMPSFSASRPSVGTGYSDVLVYQGRTKAWVEVKMNHTDNLANPRMFYCDGKWQTTYETPTAKEAVEILNSDSETRRFVKDLAKFTGIPFHYIKIPTTKAGLRMEGAVPLYAMKAYFNRPGVNRYISQKTNYNMGRLITDHYTKGKKEPASYMQAKDDFYRIGKADPFKVGFMVPLLTGYGDFKVRIATRSQFYEVQAELKIKNMPSSRYSVHPNTQKENPFNS